MRDGRAEAYLKQYVEVARGEPARWHGDANASLSQQRIRDCSRTVVNKTRAKQE